MKHLLDCFFQVRTLESDLSYEKRMTRFLEDELDKVRRTVNTLVERIMEAEVNHGILSQRVTESQGPGKGRLHVDIDTSDEAGMVGGPIETRKTGEDTEGVFLGAHSLGVSLSDSDLSAAEGVLKEWVSLDQ